LDEQRFVALTAARDESPWPGFDAADRPDVSAEIYALEWFSSMDMVPIMVACSPSRLLGVSTPSNCS
jgi:hypothetical protein